ncbi:MAG: hypothetical protein ACPL7B_06540 [Candidatus Poribacteria bacterium]
MNENLTIFQTKSIKEIFVLSYQLYKENFLKFIGITLFLKGPYLILTYVISKIISSSITAIIPTGPENVNNIEYISNVIIIELLELAFIPFISPIAISAITVNISEKCLKKNLGIAESYKRLGKRLLPLLGTILLSGMLISSGFIFALLLMMVNPQFSIMILFAPAVASLFWVWYAFIPQTVVIESEGGIGALKRSKYLTEGYFKTVFIFVVLVFIVILFITWLCSFGFSKMLFFLGDYGVFLGKGLANVVSVILEPFRIAIIPLLYFEIRFRKEGFSIDALEKELKAEID